MNDNITATELFDRIAQTARQVDTSQAAKTLHDVLVLACTHGLRGSHHAFGSLMAQVDRLCRDQHLRAADQVAIHKMRRDSNRTAEPLHPDDVAADCRALALFVSAVFGEGIPHTLSSLLPHSTNTPQQATEAYWPSIRCVIQAFDNDTLTVTVDNDLTPLPLVINYTNTPSYRDFTYLRRIFREGMQLNLIRCTVKEGTATPQMIVVEPDFLIDISTLAACFKDYGHHALNYLVRRMMPSANSQAILLGNFAGDVLDAIINSKQFDFNETLRTHFCQKALEYATCTDTNLPALKLAMNLQVENIKGMVDELFQQFNREKAILEPSFVCEQLGVQGRVDLMTSDLRLLVEQKSGKNIFIERDFNNEHGGRHIESHYVQVLLYYAVLQQNFGRQNDTRIHLMYSKYERERGLLEMKPLQALVEEAIKLRNQVVATEFFIARQGFGTLLPSLTPETIVTQNHDSYIVSHYELPRLRDLTEPLHHLAPVAHAYFCRMMTFVIKEQLVQKVGAQEGNGNSDADLWNMPLSSKREAGNIYTDLRIIEKQRSHAHSGIDTLVLEVPEQGDDFLPNFRRGDMVYLYRYAKGDTPDVRHSILYKGTLADISTHRLTLVLSDGQNNPHLFDLPTVSGHTARAKAAEQAYAIERAATDGGGRGIQALHTLMTTNAQRLALLLAQRAPEADMQRTLTRSYHPDYDEVLLGIKQATDYYLLVGPPGTGKTSMALRFMVQEALTDPEATLLLLSYTNRAVDEICAMLCNTHINFLRMGNALRSDPAYTPYLIGEAVATDPTLSGISARLAQARVVVSTTSTLQSKQELFNLKHFTMAIIDEASQILEPDIVGLLAAHNDMGQTCIDKFVLVGDYKQLPAVVQQDAVDTRVDDPLLQSIALTDCRNSLFERLIQVERRQGRKQFVGILRKQGRMHPDLAEFTNRMFYFNEHLVPVPCQHQIEQSLGYTLPARDALDRALQQHRMLFIASHEARQEGTSEKANREEARIVAQVLARIHRYYGEQFVPNKTVGVIVPYRNQIAMIRKELEALNLPLLREVSIDTVERYQGSQRDVIVYSFTIHSLYQLDFLTANSFVEDNHIIDRKLNVALTRAKKQLVLTGNPELLSHNTVFAQLINHVRQHGLFIDDKPAIM